MKNYLLLLCLLWVSFYSYAQNKLVVFQTDFGLKDGAVAEMKGVALNVDQGLKLFDLTHEIPEYNIWEAAYRLDQTVSYWPKGTVFVSVVDPGVGTSRKSIVVKTRSGHFVVTPDNGTITLLAEHLGIEAVREINETINRRSGSQLSYTFFGRDVYAYTAARLASGVITFDNVGRQYPADSLVKITYQKAQFTGAKLLGNIPVLDVQYGNVWTNIPEELFKKLNLKTGEKVHIVIFHKKDKIYEGEIPYEPTFGAVEVGKPLLYLNSLMQISVAINQDNFAKLYGIGSGSDWYIEIIR